MARRFIGPTVLALCALWLAPHSEARAQRPRDLHADLAHWQLFVDAQAAPAPVLRAEAYRLVTNGQQLTPAPEADDAVSLGPMNVRFPDTQLHRGNGRPVDGTLNEPRAIYMNGQGYLVAKAGAGELGLGFARYDAADEGDASVPSSVAQWQFHTLPDGHARDHRHRPMATSEVFALYNVVVRDYLVYDRSTQTLRWMTK